VFIIYLTNNPTNQGRMPKPKVTRQTNISHKRRRNRRRHTNRRGNSQSLRVHRRLALFPETDAAGWLQKLTWFGSVALKLFALAIGIGEDLRVETVITASGSTMILGPGDFATHSAFATAVTSSSTDREVTVLKSFPFERYSMTSMKAKIVPSADMQVRGGMYAALLVKIDPIDAETIISSKAPGDLLDKYSCKYDDIIKHPRAKMAPVHSPLNVHLAVKSQPRNIRVDWSSDHFGYVNAYPCAALCVAFSDLAASQNQVSSNYSPAKSLFEVHLEGNIAFHEPGDLVSVHNKTTTSQSACTPKIFSTESTKIQVDIYGKKYQSVDGYVDLKEQSFEDAREILINMQRLDLMDKLVGFHRRKEVEEGFEVIKMSD
jgi:hypothetical protein